MRDEPAKARILDRIERLAEGHSGDLKSIGEGVSELRFHFGPGFRIYILRSGDTLVVLLCGGHKGTQAKDIARAKEIAREWRDRQ